MQIKVIKPSFQLEHEPDWDDAMLKLENAMRKCYKSETAIKEGSAEHLIRAIIKNKHESTLEHVSMSVCFVCDRGVSHELVRHRHCSFSQESTRYVNYLNKPMEFILPNWLPDELCQSWDKGLIKYTSEHAHLWLKAMYGSAYNYNIHIKNGWRPQQARSVLPNSLKSEIVMTTNIRDWRHIFHLRCDKTAHPQMREIMIPLYDYLNERCPVLFDSVEFNRAEGE